MAEQNRTIGYICPVCGKAVIVERSEFLLAAADSHLPCPCGKSELVIHQLGDRCEITVPCLYCAKDHRVGCSNDALLRQPLLSLSCSASGLGVCVIGESDRVFSAMEKLEQAVDKMVLDTQAEQQGAFLDELVMGEVLAELRDIAARGGISCACGEKDYGIKVGFSSVDLVCAHCGGTLRLSAATPDDIDTVCAKYTVTIPAGRGV